MTGPAQSPTTMTSQIPSASQQRDAVAGHKLPIPKVLTIQTPTPVAVGPARPTLSGGTHAPSGSHVIGFPAITKAPPFELEEGGSGLLSKRKLEELVKQMSPNEKLDPEVEEVWLLAYSNKLRMN